MCVMRIKARVPRVKQKLHYQTIRWSAILGQLFLNIAVSHILTNTLFFAVPLAQTLTSFLHILLCKLEKHNPQVLFSFLPFKPKDLSGIYLIDVSESWSQ